MQVIAKWDESLGTEKQGLLRQIMKSVHRQLGEDLKHAVKEWNSQMLKLRSENKWSNFMDFPAASFNTVQFILEQSYSRACADDASILNRYEGESLEF